MAEFKPSKTINIPSDKKPSGQGGNKDGWFMKLVNWVGKGSEKAAKSGALCST
ncbi:MAG: hypothetical protein R6V54_03005 [Desulfobacteraceae bacterium]